MRHERHGIALLWTGQGGDCSALFRIASDGGFKGSISHLSAPYGVRQFSTNSTFPPPPWIAATLQG